MKIKMRIFTFIAALTLCGCTQSKTINDDNSNENSDIEVSANVETENYEALSGTSNAWGFVRKKGAPPEVTDQQEKLLSKYNGRYLDTKGNKALYLTFDEGYENGYTAMILDTLAKTDTPAAFFCHRSIS